MEIKLANQFWQTARNSAVRLLSAPLYIKVLGVGLISVAVIIGIVLPEARFRIKQIHYQYLEDHSKSLAYDLSDTLIDPISVDDNFLVMQKLRSAMENNPEVLYIIVRDAKHRITAHSFDKGVPEDLVNFRTHDIDGINVALLKSSDGLIYDAVCQFHDGYMGTVEVGVSDKLIREDLSSFTRDLLWAFARSSIICLGLAFWLAYVLSFPVKNLEMATIRIGKGETDIRARIYFEDEIGRLSAAFNQMAKSLDTYRMEVDQKETERISLIERVVDAQEEERKNISRELHDQMGPSLMALLLRIQSEGVLSMEVEKEIRSLLDDVHQLASGLRPAILSDYGLDSALEKYIRDVCSHSNLEMDYQFTAAPGLSRLPVRFETTLYRMAQESITNVIRHSNATRGSVIVLHQLGNVSVLVEDNGCGFNPSMVDTKSHFGLLGMRERALLLSGTFSVDSVPGNGTVIRFNIPLSENPNGNPDTNSR